MDGHAGSWVPDRPFGIGQIARVNVSYGGSATRRCLGFHRDMHLSSFAKMQQVSLEPGGSAITEIRLGAALSPRHSTNVGAKG
jgi:hypothetical protein